jgi:hypothetical protein
MSNTTIMTLTFTLHQNNASRTVEVAISTCIVAGWAGRDRAAIEHHIEELAAIGVPRPSAVPLYYRIAANQLLQDKAVQVVGNGSSGEAEVFIFSVDGATWISLASDHTDRELESHSVALSKQVCAKPVAHDAWLFDDVANHWDQLILRSWIVENGTKVLYQEGPLSTLQNPIDLVKDHFGQDLIPANAGMTCGTVGAIGGIRPSPVFEMELHDPVLNRSIKHEYVMDILPEIA